MMTEIIRLVSVSSRGASAMSSAVVLAVIEETRGGGEVCGWPLASMKARIVRTSARRMR